MLSVKKNSTEEKQSIGISEGDVLHVHYRTYDNKETLELLQDIAGRQDKDPTTQAHRVSENHLSPEI